MRVEVANLCKRYGRDVVALEDVGISFGTGVHGILGPNGAGKTTLVRILAGLVSPSSGTICMDGRDALTGPGRHFVHQHLGYQPQSFGAYPTMTGREFLEYIGLLKGLPPGLQLRHRIDDALELTNLVSVGHRKVRGYSGGMLRRLGIAQAILSDPTLLILDEPTAGLAPEERVRFRSLVATIAMKATVLLCTHSIDDIRHAAANVIVMNRGRVVQAGTLPDLAALAGERVWTVVTADPPPGEAVVVSAVNAGTEVEYRLLCDRQPAPGAVRVPPTIEDGYMAAIERERQA